MYQTETWKARPLSSFYLFGVVFLIFLVASPFYAWGIHELLDKYEETSKTRNSFSFGDEIVIVTGIFLGLSSYAEISRESAKARRFLMSMMACETLFDHIRIRIDTVRAASTTSKSLLTPSLCAQTCDLITMHVMLPIFFVWEACQISGQNLDTLYDLVSCLDTTNRTTVIADYFRKNLTRGSTVSTILIGLIEQRTMSLEAEGVLRPGTTTSMSASVTTARNTFSEFKVTRSNMTLWIISIANFIIALLYLLLSPFLLWFSQGWHMLISYPILFLLVGGIVSYRWYISDVILSPNTLHTKTSYDIIISICQKADLAIGTFTREAPDRHRQLCSRFGFLPSQN